MIPKLITSLLLSENDAESRALRTIEGALASPLRSLCSVFLLTQWDRALIFFNQADIEKLRVETSLLFLGLKKINRLDKHRLKVAKDAVNEVLYFSL